VIKDPDPLPPSAPDVVRCRPLVDPDRPVGDPLAACNDHAPRADDRSMNMPTRLSDRYELGETIAFGGMSEVHLGRDLELQRDVAVKVLRSDLARDPVFYLRFRLEAQRAAALNHPAIVAVYDTGEAHTPNGPTPYIVMEYVDGQTLRDILRTDGPLSPRRAIEIVADACQALHFSHQRGIVHRDVKPSNVMIAKSGAVKVMDFGIAKALGDTSGKITQTAAVLGTAQYLSPEQARGEKVDARSDVYSLGCVLYELVCGEPPFTGDSPLVVAYQHVREPGEPLPERRRPARRPDPRARRRGAPRTEGVHRRRTHADADRPRPAGSHCALRALRGGITGFGGAEESCAGRTLADRDCRARRADRGGDGDDRHGRA
jgi:serine/threonine protein kinase